MKISGNEIKTGMILEHKNDLWEVLKTQHVKPGKGGAFNQVEMKSINKNTKLNERFRSSDSVERAIVEEKEYNFLYEDKGDYYFIDNKSFEQISLNKGIMGEIKKFDRGEPSILLSQEQRDEAQRLVEAWHRDPSNVSVMMFHSVLQANIPEEMKVQGKHPWEWNNKRGEPQNQGLQGGARMGARDTQYGQWFLKNASVAGLEPIVEFNPVMKEIYRETLAQIRGGRPVTRPGEWTAEEMRQWRVDNPEGTPPWLALGAGERIRN